MQLNPLTLTLNLLPLPHSTSHPPNKYHGVLHQTVSSLVFMSPLHSSALQGVGIQEKSENE